MTRKDFLYVLLACSILIYGYNNGYEALCFSTSIALLILYASFAWVNDIVIRNMKHGLYLANKFIYSYTSDGDSTKDEVFANYKDYRLFVSENELDGI